MRVRVMRPHERPACDAKGPRPPAWQLVRYPRCNRPSGHAGPHREYAKDAAIKAEWTNAEVVTTGSETKGA